MRLIILLLLTLPLLARAEIHSEAITWKVDDVEFSGYLVYAKGGEARPGVVMVPNWMGVTDSALSKAKSIAADGYVVLVADVYGSSVRPANAQEAGAAAGRAYAGATVLELARSGYELDAVVSFHGNLTTDLPAQTSAVKAKLLVLNGADDSYVKSADIDGFEQEMRAAGADWQFVNFAGAVHCFAEADAQQPPGCVYNERAAKRAYRMMNAHLSEAFSGG